MERVRERASELMTVKKANNTMTEDKAKLMSHLEVMTGKMGRDLI